uniref:PID domain-containing protein n=1 Tax=Panagrolaimus davidi TaxID=227884 RepID=A0A914QFZ3_9BILA
MLSEAEEIILKDQLQSSNASFYVKFIGFIEVETAFHNLKELPKKRIAICNGCASLIAQAANLILKNSIDPETKRLIGDGEPECINNEIELIITNKIIRLSNFSNKKFSKKIEIPNASFAMFVGNTLENGFVFIGKEKTKKTMKRFCFLLQSQENPDNILSAFDVAFS